MLLSVIAGDNEMAIATNNACTDEGVIVSTAHQKPDIDDEEIMSYLHICISSRPHQNTRGTATWRSTGS
jgi:hypothetical protein